MKLKLFVSFTCGVLASVALAADPSYRNDIGPLIKAQCIECHGDDSPSLADFLLEQEKFKKDKQGPRISSYGDLIQLIGWPDSGALMRRLDDGANTPNKKPGNMYRHLGETDTIRATNLKLIKAWVGDGAWNLSRWEKKEDVPAITKEQMDKFKLGY
ncbi:MAG: cytochrome C [Comamonadaceae bacterium]